MSRALILTLTFIYQISFAQLVGLGGNPEIKGTNPKDLTESWTVFNRENSDLPKDVTRAIANDLDNKIWIGTDNGVIKIDSTWFLYNSQNTNIKAAKYDKNITSTIRYIEVDKLNNKWFIAGWDVYKYDNKEWKIYDSINSPIKWARKIFVDDSNNVWFRSWEGVAKFDGSVWTILDTNNSSLPSNKVLGVFVDKKKRLWIGTFDGNLMVENGKETKFTDINSPLSKAYVSQMIEDKQGNLWFELFNEKGTDAGIYILRQDNSWERIEYESPDIFSKHAINHMLLDEDKNVLWISVNGVGIMRYDIKEKKWEVYTKENSNVPSVHIEQITKDKNGGIWAATYSGVIKTNLK